MVKTVRLQRRNASEAYRGLLHWSVSKANSSFFFSGTKAGHVDASCALIFFMHRFALLKLFLNSLENVPSWVLFYQEKHSTVTSLTHYTNQHSRAIMSPCCTRKVRGIFKTTMPSVLKERKCDFNTFSVKLLAEKYTYPAWYLLLVNPSSSRQ